MAAEQRFCGRIIAHLGYSLSGTQRPIQLLRHASLISLARQLRLLQQLGDGVPAVPPALEPADHPPPPRVCRQRSAHFQLLAGRVQQMRLGGCGGNMLLVSGRQIHDSSSRVLGKLLPS